MLLGVDIGGTKILALVVDGKGGRILGRSKRKLKGLDPESVLKRAWRCAREALEDAGAKPGDLRAVGLAVPSAVDDGTALLAPALGWHRVPVVERARELFPRRPIHLGNDVNLGIAAEYLLGAARGGETVTGFFVGTGVGGAVVHEGKLLRGLGGLAGELGHVIVVPEGRRCGCGNAGCLEAYASKTAFLARIKEAIFDERRRSSAAAAIRPDTTMIGSSELHRSYRAKDRVVREIVDDGLRLLGLAAATVINILSPSHVVLGGGVVEAFGEPLVKRVRGWAAPHIFGGQERAATIVKSALGDDAVPLGAALLARERGRLLS
jgi:glucokinase